MKRKVYLGLDPGKTIGYAKVVLVWNEDGKLELDSIEVSQQKTSDWQAFGSRPLDWILESDVVAMEDFIGAGYRSKESNFTLKQIGAFELAAKKAGKTLLIQAPAKRRKYLKTAQELYLQETGEEICRHGKDALAHALKAISTLETLSPKDWIK